MPIRINLLAEAQAAEEMRRKDPVKRAVWIGGFLAVLVLLWSSSLQMKAMLAKGEVGKIEGQLAARSNEFRGVLEQQKQLQDAHTKLRALAALGTNRILYGTLLDALQKTFAEDVQIVRFRADQSYVMREAVKAKTNSTGKITPPKAATSTEKIAITLDARDTAAVPGDQVNKYRAALAGNPYFKRALSTNEVRLANLSAPQMGPDGRPYVLFSLECKFPEVTR
jgi:hypothetical protein